MHLISNWFQWAVLVTTLLVTWSIIYKFMEKRVDK